MEKRIIYINTILIGLLAIIATISGLFWKGLYNNDTIAIIAQMKGQDLITLIICVPLLLISCYLITKDSLRGFLMWMGTIFYFLYTYASMSFLASYNTLFLVYVSIFSLSLYTFLYGLFTLNLKKIKKSFSPGVIIKIAGIFTIIMAVMLGFMWLSMIIESILSGVPPTALESYTTLVIQVLDLGVLIPIAIFSGVLILKGRAWGYALMSILLVKVSLIGMAILSMIYFMIQSNVPVSWGQALFFALITVIGISITLNFYSKINPHLNSGI